MFRAPSNASSRLPYSLLTATVAQYYHYAGFIEIPVLWLYPRFLGRGKMLQREALAGALRAIRSLRGLQYGDLAQATSKSHFGDLETGKRTVTLEKLADIADALHIELTALIALTISIQRGESSELILSRASSQLLDFRRAGGQQLVADHYLDGVLQARPAGKPKKTKDLKAVQALKSAGLTQADAAKQLGLARTSVNRYWNGA